jgi:hypothetical protein
MAVERSYYAYLKLMIPAYLAGLLLFPILLLGVTYVILAAELADLASVALILPLAIYGTAANEFVYRKMMHCPACNGHVLGAISQSRWSSFELTKKLVPTHCRSCGADLRELTYRPGRLWIPKGVDEK